MSFSTTTLPRLTSLDLELDTSREAFGELVSSIDFIDDMQVLRARMREEGYLYLPGYLNRDEVLATRRVIAGRLSAEGLLEPDSDIMDCIARANSTVDFRPDLVQDNVPLHRLLYDGPMMEFHTRFLNGSVRHFDFTWLRAVAPGHGTPPHMDIVYMGRGTPNLYTAWTPLGDISLETGGLIILEKSHLHQRLNQNYGQKDVDKFCANKRGAGAGYQKNSALEICLFLR